MASVLRRLFNWRALLWTVVLAYFGLAHGHGDVLIVDERRMFGWALLGGVCGFILGNVHDRLVHKP